MENKNLGIKDDSKKPRWNLLPLKSTEEVVKVLTFGGNKYGDDNWRLVPNHKPRYFSAALRHIWAWMRGETKDPESNHHHLAHAICCLLFLMERDE